MIPAIYITTRAVVSGKRAVIPGPDLGDDMADQGGIADRCSRLRVSRENA